MAVKKDIFGTPVLDMGANISFGEIPWLSPENKFGINVAVGADYEDIWSTGGNYVYPTSAFTVEAISTSSDDNSSGVGARKVRIVGLDSNWVQQEEVLTMNGVSATDPSSTTFIRLFRAYIEESGFYSNTSSGSHQGDITIRTSGAGQTHAEINIQSVPLGQTQIARYTIPASCKGYITEINIGVSAAKPADVLLFQRKNADTVNAPFSPKRVVENFFGIDGSYSHRKFMPLGPFESKTDLWFSGKRSSGTDASISVSFGIILKYGS